MKPFWDEWVKEFDFWIDSAVLHGEVPPGMTDQQRLTELCNDLLIGRHPDLFPWPTQMKIPQYGLKDYWYLTLN